MLRKLKAANGEGTSSYNETRGRYEYKISYLDPGTNEKKRKTFTSRKSLKEAKQKAQSFLLELKADATNAAGISRNTTIGELVKKLLEDKTDQVKPKTLERYQSHFRCNIRPYNFSDFKISDLTKDIIQAHLKRLLEEGGMYNDGIAPRSVNAVRRLLIQALEDAVDNDVITKNVAKKTNPYQVEKNDFIILTHDESEKLINCARAFSRHAWIVIVIALATGLRVGEIFGLEKDNIDLVRKTLKVRKTVVTTDHGIVIQNSGKTKSAQRIVPLPDFAVAAIRRYMLWCKVQSIRFGYQYEQSKWLLSNAEGNPRSPSTFSGHQFKQCLDLAGISRKFRMHDMRHTHATWLLADKVPVKVVSERLGHSTIRITLDIYASVIESMQQEAVDALNNIFSS